MAGALEREFEVDVLCHLLQVHVSWSSRIPLCILCCYLVKVLSAEKFAIAPNWNLVSILNINSHIMHRKQIIIVANFLSL